MLTNYLSIWKTAKTIVQDQDCKIPVSSGLVIINLCKKGIIILKCVHANKLSIDVEISLDRFCSMPALQNSSLERPWDQDAVSRTMSLYCSVNCAVQHTVMQREQDRLSSFYYTQH